MDWNSCLTIGLGEGVAVALRRSGHATRVFGDV
jgi:hypothetical protein